MTINNFQVFTRKQVEQHNTENDCYVIYSGTVYNVTDFISDHPGGKELILDYAGKDISDLMLGDHVHSKSAFSILNSYKIGHLEGFALAESKDSEFLSLDEPLVWQMIENNFTKEFYLEQVHVPRHIKGNALLFHNPVLEILTRTPWYVIPLVWVPICLWAISMSYKEANPLLYPIGIFAWTLFEYFFHRFLFHIDFLLPDNKYALTVHFLLHGIHHFIPMDSYRLVMPPILMIILSIVPFYTVLQFTSRADCLMIFAGGWTGYIGYDMIHYAIHHSQPMIRYLREMKKYHARHHFEVFDLGFGVSSKLWDRVFGTEIPPRKEK